MLQSNRYVKDIYCCILPCSTPDKDSPSSPYLEGEASFWLGMLRTLQSALERVPVISYDSLVGLSSVAHRRQ